MCASISSETAGATSVREIHHPAHEDPIFEEQDLHQENIHRTDDPVHEQPNNKTGPEQDVLRQNHLLAERNRGYLAAKNILALHLAGSPGSGKTALLERTLKDMGSDLRFYVMEGDQQTNRDAGRIQATGTRVVQINTGRGCHLDVRMILLALQGLKPSCESVLFIENIGNLVCPALFDLGEKERVVILSVAEGEDKPLKYPGLFRTATLCIINKTDLLPYVPFRMDKAREYLRRINPDLEILEVSCTTGEGLNYWYRWLKRRIEEW